MGLTPSGVYLTKLNSQDTNTLLSAIANLNSELDSKSLPQRALATASSVVPADCTSFDFFSTDGRYNTTAWNDRNDILTPENMTVFGRLVHQHALIPVALKRNDGIAMKMTDVITQTQFERSELYNEFYAKLKFNRQMGLAMPVAPDLTVACVVTGKGKDFTERDRTMLSLASPHLASALRNAISYDRLNRALETGGCGVVAVDGNGRAVYVSRFAHELLKRYFPDCKSPDSLPVSISSWIDQARSKRRTSEYALPPRPIRVDCSTGTLTVRLMENTLAHETTILLEEHKSSPANLSLNGVDLTRREVEILFWLKNGKTNEVIGQLCGISMRTVQKHIEHIYRKLGVETRTAAMLRATELS